MCRKNRVSSRQRQRQQLTDLGIEGGTNAAIAQFAWAPPLL